MIIETAGAKSLPSSCSAFAGTGNTWPGLFEQIYNCDQGCDASQNRTKLQLLSQQLEMQNSNRVARKK
jgi:hypothetical protein